MKCLTILNHCGLSKNGKRVEFHTEFNSPSFLRTSQWASGASSMILDIAFPRIK